MRRVDKSGRHELILAGERGQTVERFHNGPRVGETEMGRLHRNRLRTCEPGVFGVAGGEGGGYNTESSCKLSLFFSLPSVLRWGTTDAEIMVAAEEKAEMTQRNEHLHVMELHF